MDAQAGLHFCFLQTSEDRFSHIEALFDNMYDIEICLIFQLEAMESTDLLVKKKISQRSLELNTKPRYHHHHNYWVFY